MDQKDLWDTSGAMDVTPPSRPGLAAARSARDAVLAQFERTGDRGWLVQALQDEAWRVFERTRRPVSVLDVRHVLAETGYTGDARILAAAFPRAEWTPVGFIPNPYAHARLIRTFLPNEVLG